MGRRGRERGSSQATGGAPGCYINVMFPVPAAVSAAISFLRELRGDAMAEPLDIRLEEVESGEECTKITLSYAHAKKDPLGIHAMGQVLRGETPLGPRHYKIFEVNNDGRVVAMRIRKLDDAS
jgi:hypothetical protein